MCGICGIVSTDYSTKINSSLIKSMMSVMNHRGPDDNGSYVEDGKVALGHNRLSIIDLSSGRQPILNEDNTKCIIFNGEIYNYLELRNDLISRGHIFRTKSDTEVILHLYEEKGVRCAEYLRGMFAFAIWDKIEKTLFLVRDRLGIKPLYYHESDGNFCFASEIKSILKSELIDRKINTQSVDQFLTLNYVIGPETILDGVKKLMPGHFMVLKDGHIDTSQYWDFNDIEETTDSFDVCYHKMEKLIEGINKDSFNE